MEASREKEHLLALKVMRLTKPSLMPFHPLICDKRDLSGGIYQQMDADDLSKPSGVDYFGVGDLLTLPQNFGNILCPALTCEDNKEFCQLSKWNESLDKGKTAKIKQYLNLRNIFLGETFSSYISVHNDSLQLCRDIAVKDPFDPSDFPYYIGGQDCNKPHMLVKHPSAFVKLIATLTPNIRWKVRRIIGILQSILKADLQTSSQRLMLSGVTPHPTAQLTPDDSIDGVIHHEVKELGTHILVCAVSYVSESGEKMAFRKFFKFQVLKPLDVKTKFYNAESDEVYLEAQIQNITPGPIFMDHVSLEPSISYTVKKMNDTPDTEGSHPVFGKVNYLNSLDTRQYLYCLTPKPEAYAESKVLKGVTNIGKLDITWRTNMGERGRLQTSQLQRVAPGYGDIRLTVESIPDTVTLETTFTITFRITNCCERVVDLTLILQNNISAGVLWCGLSGKQLGKLPQNNSMDLPLTVIATSPGLQTVSGLRLTDNFLKRTYEHDEIAQVFVCG